VSSEDKPELRADDRDGESEASGGELELAKDELVVLLTPGGSAVVAGADDLVDDLVASVGRPASAVRLNRVAGRPVADLAATVGAIAGLAGTQGTYFELAAGSAQKLQAGELMDAGGGWKHGVIRAASGQITDLAKIRKVDLVPMQALSLQTAAATLALRAAIAEVEHAIEELSTEVATLRAIAVGEQLGDVVGLHRVLRRARQQADELGRVPSSTWDSIAPHQVTAQQGADPARAILSRLVAEWPTGKGISARAAVAGRMAKERTLHSWLTLVAVSEANLLLWQSLKTDRISQTDPDVLPNEARLGQSLAQANRAADQKLVDRVAAALDRMGGLHTSDQPHWIKAKQLQHNLGAMHNELAGFANLHGLSITPYVPRQGAIERTYANVRSRTSTAVQVGRRTTGDALQHAGTAIAGGIDRPAIELPHDASGLDESVAASDGGQQLTPIDATSDE
jgi:hypothetical protein